MTKIFIATGWQGGFRSVGNNIEIVDLQGNGQQCTQQYPFAVDRATGGLIAREEGIICGGTYPIRALTIDQYQYQYPIPIPIVLVLTIVLETSFQFYWYWPIVFFV